LHIYPAYNAFNWGVPFPNNSLKKRNRCYNKSYMQKKF